MNKLISCACGCGTLIPSINKLGKPARFAHGHNIHLRTREESKRIVQLMHQARKINPPKGSKAGHWKGGRMVDKRGYVHIYLPNHPRANSDHYIPEHWLIMEQKLGRILTLYERVHHINGNPSDNRLENLLLVTPKVHINIHRNNGDLHDQDGNNHIRALKAWETKRKHKSQTHTSSENRTAI